MKAINCNSCGKYFKVILFLSFILWITPSAWAQEEDSGASAKAGKVFGKVLDGTNDDPLEFATVSVIAQGDSTLVFGNITDQNGKFFVEGIPVGDYRVEVYFIGYRKAVKEELSISKEQMTNDLGVIKLNSGATDLAEVVVTGERSEVERSFDKKIYNINKNIMNEGASALEALGNIPFVAVNFDGAVTLKGDDGVMVLVDGKPLSGMKGAGLSTILEQIPANTIDKVEIVTNPSARYDAEGVSGIINVVLKKKSLVGTNLLINLAASTRDKYRASVNLDHKTGKFNTYAAFSFNHNPFFLRGGSERVNLLDNPGTLVQALNGRLQMDSYFFRAGADYSISDKSTLGTSLLYGIIDENNREETSFKQYNESQVLDNIFVRNKKEVGNGYNLNANLDFDQKFAKEGVEFTSSISYAANTENNDVNFLQQQYELDNTPSSELPAMERNLINNDDYSIAFTNDLTYPVGEGGVLEFGHKSAMRKLNFKMNFSEFSYVDDQWTEQNLKNNDFSYEDWVHAAYAMFSKEYKSFSYQLGLRAEHTSINTLQRLTGQMYNRDYLNVFPSLHLSYEFPNGQFIEFGYGRGIERPRDRKVNPLVDYSDPQNLFFGNPDLAPELTDDYELAYEFSWGEFSLTSGIFYQETHDIIQRVVSLNEDNVSLITYENINNRRLYGAQFNAQYDPLDWLRLTFDCVVFKVDIDGSNVNEEFTTGNQTGMFEFSSQVKVPKIATFKVFAHYRGPIAVPQGVVQEMYSIDLAIQRSFADKRGSISLNISDVFNTQQYGADLGDSSFSYNFWRKRESQIGRISISYKLGKMKANKKNREIRAPKDKEDYF